VSGLGAGGNDKEGGHDGEDVAVRKVDVSLDRPLQHPHGLVDVFLVILEENCWTIKLNIWIRQNAVYMNCKG
jgi:hypothetical protein